ncbi:hypothetical protein D3C79_1009050 [compost metagenome]
MPGAVVVRVFFEDLVDEGPCCFGAQVLDQQVYADDGQLFRAARAVRDVALWPLDPDVGFDTDGVHGWARESG